MAEENNTPGTEDEEERMPLIDQFERMLEPEQEPMSPEQISGGIFEQVSPKPKYKKR